MKTIYTVWWSNGEKYAEDMVEGVVTSWTTEEKAMEHVELLNAKVDADVKRIRELKTSGKAGVYEEICEIEKAYKRYYYFHLENFSFYYTKETLMD